MLPGKSGALFFFCLDLKIKIKKSVNQNKALKFTCDMSSDLNRLQTVSVSVDKGHLNFCVLYYKPLEVLGTSQKKVQVLAIDLHDFSATFKAEIRNYVMQNFLFK